MAIGPEIDSHAYQVIDGRVRALIQQDGGKGADRVDDQSRLDAPVDRGRREPIQRPFPRETDETQDEVEDLQDGNGAHGAIEVGGEKVPEDLGPEEALEGRRDLVYKRKGG